MRHSLHSFQPLLACEKERGKGEREGEGGKERERWYDDNDTGHTDSCIPWSVFVAGFQFSGLMMGRHTWPFSSMLGW